MKKKSPLLWLIPLILLLLVIPFIVPSALPVAGAEETDLPVYAPVELANPHPAPLLPLPSAREPNPITFLILKLDYFEFFIPFTPKSFPA